MQKLIKLKALLTLCLMTAMPFSVEGRCKAPERGPPGPAGAIASAYASAYTTGSQVTTTNPYSITFNQNQVNPVGIDHPVNGTGTQFRVQRSGFYLVGWTFSVFDVEGAIVTVNLVNSGSGTPFPPAPLGTQTLPSDVGGPGINEIISGQTIVFLPEGTIIELQVGVSSGTVQILNPTLIMALIAPLV